MAETPMRRSFGNAAHLIVGNWCRFHIATQIGEVLISTVGEYHVRQDDAKPKEIGYGRLYETMVFRVEGACECGCGLPSHGGSEQDFAGYNSATEANAGHEAMCEKYALGVLSAPVVEGTR